MAIKITNQLLNKNKKQIQHHIKPIQSRKKKVAQDSLCATFLSQKKYFFILRYKNHFVVL